MNHRGSAYIHVCVGLKNLKGLTSRTVRWELAHVADTCQLDHAPLPEPPYHLSIGLGCYVESRRNCLCQTDDKKKTTMVNDEKAIDRKVMERIRKSWTKIGVWWSWLLWWAATHRENESWPWLAWRLLHKSWQRLLWYSGLPLFWPERITSFPGGLNASILYMPWALI